MPIKYVKEASRKPRRNRIYWEVRSRTKLTRSVDDACALSCRGGKVLEFRGRATKAILPRSVSLISLSEHKRHFTFFSRKKVSSGQQHIHEVSAAGNFIMSNVLQGPRRRRLDGTSRCFLMRYEMLAAAANSLIFQVRMHHKQTKRKDVLINWRSSMRS